MCVDLEGLLEALDESVGELFETTAFSVVYGRKVESAFPGIGEYCLGASVNVFEPLNVCFTLVLTRAHAREIYETIYGKECSGDCLTDLVSEFANTAAGRLAAAFPGKGGDMEIGLPVPVEGVFEDSGEGSPGEKLVVAYEIDERTVICCLEAGTRAFPGAFRIKPPQEDWSTDEEERQTEDPGG